MTTIKNFALAANGTPLGIYQSVDAEAAILAYARDAGYRDVADAAAVIGQTEEKFVSDFDVEEVADVDEVA